MSYRDLGYKNSRQKVFQLMKKYLKKKIVSFDEVSEKSLNLERDKKKKTVNLDKVTKEKTLQLRQK